MNSLPLSPTSYERNWGAFRITMIYLVIGGLWILLSDQFVAAGVREPPILTRLSILKGTWTDEVACIHDLDPAQPTNLELGVSFYLPESRVKIENAIREAVELARSYDLELQMVSAKGQPNRGEPCQRN